MTKEEMKNRISMALKDPILQQGFEVICKNLAKLESRNDNLVKMYNEMVERQNSLQQSLYKDLAELEKENAELNKANEWHYVKDGDLPFDTDEVLVCLISDEIVIDCYHSNTGWENYLNNQVRAWKEIVPPKESE